MRRAIFLLSCLVVIPGLMSAQQADAHFQTPRLAPTAHRSTFIHGYLHGYEEGFHEADFDLHMGRIARSDYTHIHVPNGYKKQFGPKRIFESGFGEGFRVGYTDGAAGRSFRAIGNVESAISSENAEDVRQSGPYDEGVRLGYIAGQHQGLDDARSQHQAKPSPSCPVNSGQSQQEFCSAYNGGYEIGYSDGFVNQTKTTVAAAKR